MKKGRCSAKLIKVIVLLLLSSKVAVDATLFVMVLIGTEKESLSFDTNSVTLNLSTITFVINLASLFIFIHTFLVVGLNAVRAFLVEDCGCVCQTCCYCIPCRRDGYILRKKEVGSVLKEICGPFLGQIAQVLVQWWFHSFQSDFYSILIYVSVGLTVSNWISLFFSLEQAFDKGGI